MLAGTGLMTVVGGWIAYITEGLKPYATASYFLVALISAVLILSVFAAYNAWIVNRMRKRALVQWRPDADSINLLGSTFTKKRINILSIVDPITKRIEAKNL